MTFRTYGTTGRMKKTQNNIYNKIKNKSRGTATALALSRELLYD